MIVPALIIIFIAFFIHSITGFGSGLLSVPFLAFFYPIKTVSPVINILGLLSNLLIIGTFYKQVNWKILFTLTVGNIIGSLIGGRFLSIAENTYLVKLLGILIILFSLNHYFRKKYQFSENHIISTITGTVSGFLSAIFAIGGPPLVLYLAGVIKKKETLRATLLAFFVVNGFIQVPVLAANGLVTREVLVLAAICLPVGVIASWIGYKVNLAISEKVYKTLIVAILLFSGVLLFFK